MDVQTVLNQFVANSNGRALDYDHQYGAQCVDLIQYWAKALGKRPFTGNAINVGGENHDQWQWVANTPSGVPTPGSIMCYAANNRSAGTGPYGHVDLFLSGNASSFTALDQNWAGKQYCVEVHHPSYIGVIGWLEPIVSTPAPHGGWAQVVHPTNVRVNPTTTSAVTGSGLLQPGNTFSYSAKVVGQDVNQNGVHTNIWYHSTLGHYVWSGNVKDI